MKHLHLGLLCALHIDRRAKRQFLSRIFGLISSIFMLFFFSTRSFAQQIVFESWVQLPYGASNLVFLLAQPRTVHSFMVTYQRSPQCRGFNVGVETAPPGQPWTRARYVSGAFYPTVQPISSVRLALTSASAYQMCWVTIWMTDTPGATEDVPLIED